MEAYSRDSLAEPLRALQALLRQVSGGSFRPDETRSGMLEESDGESSAPSTASEASGSEDTAHVDEEALPDLQFVMNMRSGVLHRVLDGRMACGKALPIHSETLEELPADAPRCARCF